MEQLDKKIENIDNLVCTTALKVCGDKCRLCRAPFTGIPRVQKAKKSDGDSGQK